ncbi:LysR family transcriptional regulator [Arthrobacter sp. BB-1]|jgi:DNA-binding transcriptional LysR family regulator|uniref:LysR family transcriptional regulator n=1 Tax=Micrococcaceae TaxID=1268 RepID=UPI0010CE5495|nr:MULTISPECIES: LysR family transcriptional regulator [Micrococcaceae]TNB73614.1 LysR family transcriptional regulator [Arthrobacter sp. BB-1]UEL29552.1 LysR family transcriptional regulator [Pseudarthrobacter sp. L1SW]VII95187.1 Transcriptional regulator, LysR family [Arthrobacter sp. DR-2P]
METRRLEVLLELARQGSMRNVADSLGTTTSTVSQQIAALARETGAALLEPDGRRVRLTPAGRRLADHAVTILAAVDAATAELDPGAEPAGTVRVAGFVTAVRKILMPIVEELAVSHPGIKLEVREHEPAEALALLADDSVDLALTYDYNLAPDSTGVAFDSVHLWSTPWSLGVPEVAAPVAGSAPEVLASFRDRDWIGNSRNRADEDVLRLLASMGDFEPRVRHQADSLELVEDLILAGMGVGLLPADREPRAGVALVPLNTPDVRLRAYARTRRGNSTWPALAAVLGQITGKAAALPDTAPARGKA